MRKTRIQIALIFSQILKRNIDVKLLFLLCLAIFSFLILKVKTDITVHIDACVLVNTTSAEYSPNFLFYYLVNLLSGFSNHVMIMYAVGLVLLSTATVVKYVISKKIIKSVVVKKSEENLMLKLYPIALGLFFCFAILDPFFYFSLGKAYSGKIAPIAWHNSTTIMLFPFAILLFWKQLSFFERAHKTTTKDILIINGLVILNVFIKPSFLFVYIPITFLFLLPRIKFDTFKMYFLKQTPLIMGGLIILIQRYLIYETQMGSIHSGVSGIAISSPFEVMLQSIPVEFIPISFLTSFAFPIFTMLFYKEIIRYKPFFYSLALMILGILISTFIMETGPRKFHGNFSWQNVICSYLLFLSTVLFLTPKFLDKNLRTKKILFLKVLFIIHALSGIGYLIKIVATGSCL